MYGLDPAADLWADEIESHGLQGSSSICISKMTLTTFMSVDRAAFGAHRPESCSAGMVEGLSWTEIIARLQETNSQLRLVAVHSRNGALILDDTYNASPNQL